MPFDQATEEIIVKKQGKMRWGDRLVALMGVFADQKALNTSQRLSLLTTLAQPMSVALSGDLDTLKVLVTAITPDGTLITDSDKTTILSEIDAYPTVFPNG